MHYEEVFLSEDGAARLDCYLLDPEVATGVYKTRPALLIAPGGAYLKLAHREGEPVATRFLGMGYNVFVLHYHVYVTAPPAEPDGMPQVDTSSHYPLQIVDAMRAMAYVREHANEWDVDTNRVYTLGFSAGAHVVGSLAERFDDVELLAQAGTTAEVARPSGLVLCYPMVSAGKLCHKGSGNTPEQAKMVKLITRAVFGKDDPSSEEFARVDLRKHVRPNMPRTFVWQTGEDEVVTSYETTELVALLQRAGVPVEFHLYERGIHGMALADRSTASREDLLNDEAATWAGLCANWLALDDKGELSHC
ncbi:MAG: alpha/beta hydrolase [Atopobiaceae bacterium]|nr:alpha/beta hydrolase [Atopobiaceae bacterium]